MLCKRHNETLSPTDSEAGKLLRILNRFVTRAEMRSRGSDHNGDVDTYALSGSLLERWFLKTVINLTFGQPLADGSRWAPQENWVRIIFGLTPFPDDCGLYFGELIARDIPPGKSALNIQMFKEEDRVVGAQFRLNEFLFIISMVPLLLNEETRYHPDAIKEIRDGDTKQVITFAWDSPVSA